MFFLFVINVYINVCMMLYEVNKINWKDNKVDMYKVYLKVNFCGKKIYVNIKL